MSSGLPAKADIARRSRHVSKVPLVDMRGVSVIRLIRTRFSADRRRPRRRPVAQGREMSNGCTFSPPAIRGFDGSKRSRISRFLTSERAITKASFRLLACRSAILKKSVAEIGPFGFVPAAEGWMVGIRRGDYQRIGV